MLEATLREKACVVCGQIFKPNSARQKYCSDACRCGTKTCIQCGKEFLQKERTTGNFCSRACWYAWPGRIEDRECPVCGKMFRPNDSRQKTCSMGCSIEVRRTAVRNTRCEQCGKPLAKDVHPRVRFCSRSCGVIHRSASPSPAVPVGTLSKQSCGYMNVKIRDASLRKKGDNWMLEHRYVMEQMLGRPLLDSERVHHKNGDRADNRPENLELWTVEKKDPAGQRVLDLVKDMITRLPSSDRDLLRVWMEAHRPTNG